MWWNKHPSNSQESNSMGMARGLALWLAILVVLLSLGFIWQAANWLTINVIAKQVTSYYILSMMPYVLAGVIAMALLYSSRMGLGSGIALGAFWLLSKSPVF